MFWRDFFKLAKIAIIYPYRVKHLPWSYHITEYCDENENPEEWHWVISTYEWGLMYYRYVKVQTTKDDPFIAERKGKLYRLWGNILLEERFIAESTIMGAGKHPFYTPRAETPNEHITFCLTPIRGTKKRRYRGPLEANHL